MKLAMICFLIGLTVFFLWPRKKEGVETKKEKSEPKKDEKVGSKKKIWEKKGPYVWIFILQFVILNFIYPGGWFEVKTLFWFFATRNSDKYVAIKEIKNIIKKDESQKTSSVMEKIKELKKKEKLDEGDREKLDQLASEINKTSLVVPTLRADPAPTPVVWDWTFEWEATPEQLRRNSNQEKGLVNDARVIFRDEKVLKFNYKRPSGKLVELTLSRNDSAKGFYQGKVSQSDLYLRVWLITDEKRPENFRGTADNGPNTTQMEVFLKRKL